MDIKRSDGGKLSLIEQFILLELFTQQYSPIPYTNEQLKAINKKTGMLELHASFKRRDDEKVDEDMPHVEYDDIVFSFDMNELNLDNSAVDIWHRIQHDLYFNIYREKLKVQISEIIGTSWEELSLVPWYNGLSHVILSWKHLNENHHLVQENYAVHSPQYYGYQFEDKNEGDIAQLMVFWMLAVERFGEYGTSPRSGWILLENWDKFCEWCDAICYNDIMNTLECIYE